MTFQEASILLKRLKNKPLPGVQAQMKMAPKHRRASLNASDTFYSFKPSAVLMLIYPKDDQAHFILIRRAAYNGVHSNQIGLPGGRKEESDTDLKYTAFREAKEEIGIEPDEIILTIPMTALPIPVSSYIVRPFIGLMNKRPVFNVNAHEVVHIIEVPLKQLLDDRYITQEKFYNRQTQQFIHAPCFQFGDFAIWGATAMILSEVKTFIKQSPH